MDEACGVTGGPLAPYEDALRAELAATGYADSSVADVVRTMDRLSVWLQVNGRTAADLTPTVVEKFLALRREHSSSGEHFNREDSRVAVPDRVAAPAEQEQVLHRVDVVRQRCGA